jgi:hypothetical protein
MALAARLNIASLKFAPSPASPLCSTRKAISAVVSISFHMAFSDFVDDMKRITEYCPSRVTSARMAAQICHLFRWAISLSIIDELGFIKTQFRARPESTMPLHKSTSIFAKFSVAEQALRHVGT